jgi:methylmalonyl-CoA carboxyltransferase 1.3S subunit
VKLKIVIDGKTYDVDVEVEDTEQPIYGVGGYVPMSPARIPTPVPVRPPEGTPPPQGGDDKVCRSPISGIVVRLTAEVGQQIEEGDTLMVLEAMKMETDITASAGGKVHKINVKAGDSVQGGQVLVEFE